MCHRQCSTPRSWKKRWAARAGRGRSRAARGRHARRGVKWGGTRTRLTLSACTRSWASSWRTPRAARRSWMSCLRRHHCDCRDRGRPAACRRICLDRPSACRRIRRPFSCRRSDRPSSRRRSGRRRGGRRSDPAATPPVVGAVGPAGAPAAVGLASAAAAAAVSDEGKVRHVAQFTFVRVCSCRALWPYGTLPQVLSSNRGAFSEFR